MDDRMVVRLEIEYGDGEVRRADGPDADAIWRMLMASHERELIRGVAVYQGPSLRTVRGPRAGDGMGGRGGESGERLSLADLARRGLAASEGRRRGGVDPDGGGVGEWAV